MTADIMGSGLLSRYERLSHWFVWRRKRLHHEIRDELIAAEQAAAVVRAELNVALQRQHEGEATTRQLETQLNLAIKENEVLVEERDNFRSKLEQSLQQHLVLKMSHEELVAKHWETSTFFQLIAKLHNARPAPNDGVIEFNRLLNEDYMQFASEDNFPAAKANSLLILQSIAQDLKLIARCPDIHRRRIVSIAGGFSAGKSSFINSFIEDSRIRLAEGIRPVTAIPSHIIASEDSSILACSVNGGSVDLEPSFYTNLSHSLINSIGFNFRELMPSALVRTALDRGLFEHICLTDTPGYNPGSGVDNAGIHDRQLALGLAHRSDELIWMIGLDSDGTVPNSDIEFLNEIDHVRPIYVVLNKADLRSRSDTETIMIHVDELFQSHGLKVAGISAYSSRQKREVMSRGKSLLDFLRGANVPSNTSRTLIERVNKVFDMHDEALSKARRRARHHIQAIEGLRLDCYEIGGPDLHRKMNAALQKLASAAPSLPKNHLFKQSAKLRQNFIACIDQIMGHLDDDRS